MTEQLRPIRIDAHHHVWDLTARDQPWTAGLPALRRSFAFGELRPQLACAGIGATVLVQTVTDPAETPELLQLAERTPQIAGVVGWVDLTADDVVGRLAALRAGPGGSRLVGIRHQVQEEPDPEWLLRPDVQHGLRAVAGAGLSFDLLVVPAQLPAAIGVVQRLPELRFILDHGGKPPIAAGGAEPWRRQTAVLSRLPNVAVKLSGLLTEAPPDWAVETIRPYADHLLSSFGAHRTMFGSDWPVCTLRASYGEVATVTQQLLSGCSEAESSAIFGASAASWYRLGAVA